MGIGGHHGVGHVLQNLPEIALALSVEGRHDSAHPSVNPHVAKVGRRSETRVCVACCHYSVTFTLHRDPSPAPSGSPSLEQMAIGLRGIDKNERCNSPETQRRPNARSTRSVRRIDAEGLTGSEGCGVVSVFPEHPR
jgi:hypothetical protein